MSRLTWIETMDGWISGRYQIELAAPQLWVLSRRPDTPPIRGPMASELILTSGSLRALKQMADELELRRFHRRRLLRHLVAVTVLAVVTVAGAVFDLTPMVAIGLAALFVQGLRALVVWLEQVHGRAWSSVSKAYQ